MSYPYKSIFFDADDTLLDYPLAERMALAACQRHFRIHEGEESLVAAFRRINSRMWLAYERREIRQEEIPLARFRQLLTDLGLERVNPQKISDYYLDIFSQQAQLIDGAVEVVTGLSRNYVLVLITNGIARAQRPRFERSGLLPFFSQVIISEEVGLAKPDPRILWPALQALNLSPLEVLLVGDSVSSDMACAARVGCAFCWFNPGQLPVPKEYVPTHVISSLHQLLKIV